MNSSSSGQNVSTVRYQDSHSTALAKNVIVVALGITINYINGTLVHTFRKHQVFYLNPRYILFIHLVVNDMIQLATAISLFVLSYVFYRISTSLCCVIISFALFTSVNSPLNLAVMAVECYIAVCFPLRHSDFCTIRRIYIVIMCIWIMSILSFLPDIFYLLAIKSEKLLFPTVVCEENIFFQDPAITKKREVVHLMYLVCVWLVLFYTYLHIFFAARSAKSADSESNKARRTILLHSFQLFLCMLTFIYAIVNRYLFFFFPRIYLHLIFVWYILVQILPRFVSPILYGLRDTTFRHHLKKYLFCATQMS